MTNQFEEMEQSLSRTDGCHDNETMRSIEGARGLCCSSYFTR